MFFLSHVKLKKLIFENFTESYISIRRGVLIA